MDATVQPANAAVRRTAIAGALCLATVAVGILFHAESGSAVSPSGPNVVVLMSDDQEARSLGVMKKVKRKIARRGVSFSNSFVNFPLCCPSRATFFTGQYAHNHGVASNKPPEGGFERLDSTNTLPVWLSDAGIPTAHFGRYLNHYGVGAPQLVPQGWEAWYGLPQGSAFHYFDFTLNQNGRLVNYTGRDDYQTDVLTRKAVSYIKRNAKDSKPFFLSVGYLAPHVGGPRERGRCGGRKPKPAPRHDGAFADAPLPRPPSFNERDVSDKPEFIRRLPPLEGSALRKIVKRYRCRLASLLAVDDSAAKIVQALRRAGELDDSYVIFTSDNGFMFGEHRLKGGKQVAYEESIRVPLVIRGPGIPRGKKSNDLVINADLAPTALDAMNVGAGLPQDGRSLLPAAKSPRTNRRRTLLIEAPGDYAGVRTRRYSFVVYDTRERELYDLRKDPYQLRNRAGDRSYRRVEDKLATKLRNLRDCSGIECR